MSSRLTKVQTDVLDLMRKDGWIIRDGNGMWTACELFKQGEPPRHVANATVLSLKNRGLITGKADGRKQWWIAA